MRGIGAGTRVFELLDRSPAITPNTGIIVPSARRGTISFENIQFEYPSRKGVEVLKDFNLDVGVGESVAIMCVLENPRITHLDRGYQREEWEREVVDSISPSALLRPYQGQGDV